MQYEVIKGRINGKVAGELVELDEEVAESYGDEYVKEVKGKKSNKDATTKDDAQNNKELKGTQNKALSNKDATTKDEQGGTDQ